MKKIILIVALFATSFIANAQVGIGTTSPQGALHIDGSQNNPATGVPSAAQLADDVVIKSTGNVGIGTATPTEKLTVEGAISSRNATGGYATLNPGTATQAGFLAIENATKRLGYIGYDNTNLIYNSQNSAHHVFTGGNIGVNNSVPNAPLDVIGAAEFNSGVANAKTLQITSGNVSLTNPRLYTASGAIELQSDETVGANRIFNLRKADSDVITALSNGNVGIGNTAPAEKLAVEGTISSRQAADGYSQLNPGNGNTSGYLSIHNATQRIGYIGFHSSDMRYLAQGGDHRFDGGNIVLGTNASPTSKLFVRGPQNGATPLVDFFVDNYTASPNGAPLKLSQSNSAHGPTLIIETKIGTAAAGQDVQFRRAGNVVGSISIQASTTAYNTTSDERLKTKIKNTSKGISDLMQLEVKDYIYKADATENEQMGLLAQELYKVIPNAVSVGGDDPKTQPWMVDYSKLTPLLIKAIQDLKTEVDSLKLEISSLKK